jgi:hypothetical protein
VSSKSLLLKLREPFKDKMAEKANLVVQNGQVTKSFSTRGDWSYGS